MWTSNWNIKLIPKPVRKNASKSFSGTCVETTSFYSARNARNTLCSDKHLRASFCLCTVAPALKSFFLWARSCYIQAKHAWGRNRNSKFWVRHSSPSFFPVRAKWISLAFNWQVGLNRIDLRSLAWVSWNSVVGIIITVRNFNILISSNARFIKYTNIQSIQNYKKGTKNFKYLRF